MRQPRLVSILVFLCGACACSPRVDLPALMGSPDDSGLLIIECSMLEKQDNFLAADNTAYISSTGCSILAKKRGSQPVEAAMSMGYFVFPNLAPGLYCIESISGQLVKSTSGPGPGSIPNVQTSTCHYTFRFSPWNVREAIIEVPAGVPVYLGQIVITEPYQDYPGGDVARTIRRVDKSEGVKIDGSSSKEKRAWKALLDKYPESPWSAAVQARLAALQGK